MMWPLIDSDIWVAVVVAGETPGKARNQKHDGALQDKAIPQTDNVAIKDLPMDPNEEPKTQMHGTHPSHIHPRLQAEKKGDNPIQVWVECHKW